MEEVILVNEHDQEIGVMEKMEAHAKAQLHRAFSVFVINNQKEILIHQRALEKYHSGGLWTNACCSHPRPGETLEDATQRRLMEEMGFTCPVEKVFSFIYKAELDSGMTEHEFDHVFIGEFNGTPQPNPAEVMDYKWLSYDELHNDLREYPERYTEWFKICFNQVSNIILV